MSSSSDGKTFNTEITADPSKFEQGFKQAVAAATSSSAQIDAQFKKIGDAVSRVNSVLLGFTAVLAGGGALKKFITDANEWNATAGKMASQLKISTQEASVLNTALTRLGIDSDVMLKASQLISKSVQGNAQAFDVLGVKVRDASGAYRPVTELMGEVNQKLLDIKNPIEQNIAGQQIYGKGWAEVRGILRLTAEQLAASEVRARQLGLIVGPEGVAMSKQYQAQMRDLNLVGKSLEVQFGNALLPVFTRIGSFMSQEGPQAGQVFATILEGIAFAASATWLALKDMGDGMGALAAQAAALLSGDLDGFRAIGKARDEEAAKNEAAYERLKASFGVSKSIAIPAAPDVSQGPRYRFKEKLEGSGTEAPSRLGGWEAQLETAKAAIERQGLLEGQYRQRSLAENLAFYQQLLQRKDLTETEKVQITRKAAELEMADIRNTFDVRVKTLQAESEAYKANFDEKLRIELQVQAMYAAGTKEYEESQKRINAIRRGAADQAKQVAQVIADAQRQALLSGLALEEQTLRQYEQLGLVSHEQVLQQQQAFENRRNAIAYAALQERLALEQGGDKDPVKIAQVNAQIEALEQGHQQRLAQIQGDLQATQLAPIVAVYQAAETALGNAITGLISRTQTLGQAMRSVWQGISGSIIGEISKILAKKAAAWAVERGLSLFSTTAKAVEAGAGAAASVAPIPIVGPSLALAALASVMGAVMATKSSIPSAYAGYDIPAGLNPMTQLHEREMVLPAKHADVIRAMADGQAPAQGLGGGPVQIYGSPDDSIKLRDLPKVLKALGRDHVFVGNR